MNESESGMTTTGANGLDRDEKGKFQRGNGVGRGKPKKRDALRALREDYVLALLGVLTVEKWTEIVQRVVNDSIAGDHAATRVLFDYILGKPTQMSIAISSQPGTLPPITVVAYDFDYNAAISPLAPLGPDGQPLPPPTFAPVGALAAGDIESEENGDAQAYP